MRVPVRVAFACACVCSPPTRTFLVFAFQNLSTPTFLNMGKPSGLRCGRKLRNHRRIQRWAQKVRDMRILLCDAGVRVREVCV